MIKFSSLFFSLSLSFSISRARINNIIYNYYVLVILCNETWCIHHLNCILFHLNSIHEIFLPILIRFSYVNFNIVQRVIVSLMMILMGNISPLVLGKFHIIILNSWKLSSLKNYKKKKKNLRIRSSFQKDLFICCIFPKI